MGERAPWLPYCASRSNSALTWGDRLRAFSDNVRDRRLLRAEERAKMVGPLSLFIFPVILGIAMLPGIIRLITVLKYANRHITGDRRVLCRKRWLARGWDKAAHAAVPLTFAMLAGKLLFPDLFPRRVTSGLHY
jgi:hypothetical protein